MFPHVFFVSIPFLTINAETGESDKRERKAMQYEKALKLKEEWGDKPCTHPSFQKEYYQSSQTGDYVCTQCGETFTLQEKIEIEKKRNNY